MTDITNLKIGDFDSGGTDWDRASIARDSTGNLYAVWHQDNGAYSHIRFAKSDDDGATWDLSWVTTVAEQTTYGLYHCMNPKIVVDGQNRIHVVWNSFYTGHSRPNILHRVSTDGGSTWSAPNYITAETSDYQYFPDIAVDENDKLHVAWRGQFVGSTFWYNIRYSYSSDQGTTWATIQNLTPHSGSPYTDIQGKRPRVVVDNLNYIYVIYAGKVSGSLVGVLFRKSTNGGSSFAAESTIQADSGYSQLYVDACSDSAGNIYVVWRGDDGTYSANNIRFVKSTDGGSSWTGLMYLTTSNSYVSDHPSVSVDRNNNIHVAFEHQTSGSGSGKYIGHTKSTDGGSSWSTIDDVITTTDENTRPQLLSARHPGYTNISYAGFAMVWVEEDSEEVFFGYSDDFENIIPLEPLGDPDLLYSQKTGVLFDDSTVWNTERGGGGDYKAPKYNDRCVIQDGHVITSNSGGMAPAVYGETGSSFVIDHQLHFNGSFMFLGTLTINKPIAFHNDGWIHIPNASDDCFSQIIVKPGVTMKVMNGTPINATRLIRVDGTLDFRDYGVNFDDDAEYISIDPSSGDFDLSISDACTIYARVRWKDTPAAGTIFHLEGSTGDAFILSWDGTDLTFRMYESAAYDAEVAFSPVADRIYHIFCVRLANGQTKLYIDSEEQDHNLSGSTAGMAIDDEVTIGNNSNAVLDDHHQGDILEFAYWNGVLKTVEHMQNYIFSSTDIFADSDVHLNCNEGTGTDIEDDADHDDDGVIVGGADWVVPESWTSERDTIITETGTVYSLDGLTRSLYIHGDLKIDSGYYVEYIKHLSGIASRPSAVRSTVYRSTETIIDIDDSDDMADLNINGFTIERRMNDWSKVQLILKKSTTTDAYLLSKDKISISQNGYGRIMAKILSGNPTPDGVIKVMGYDPIFEMKRRRIPRWIHFQNMMSFQTVKCKKVGLGSHEIDPDDIISYDIFQPFLSVLLLNTTVKQLEAITGGTDRYLVGKDASLNRFVAAYPQQEPKGGEFLRISFLLMDVAGTGDIRWAIMDFDPDSDNYDEVIVEGVIMGADLPTGSPDYVTISIPDTVGRGYLPTKKLKIVLGGDTGGDTRTAYWYGTYGVLHQGCKVGTSTDATEANLGHYEHNYSEGGDSFEASLLPAFEVEMMGDWDESVDPYELTYSTTKAVIPSGLAQPSFANVTRKIDSEYWRVARVTGFYDCWSFDTAVIQVFNSWYRDIFGEFDVDVDTDQFPYFLVEGKSPYDAILDYIMKYDATAYHYYDESNSRDVLKIELNQLISDWSGLSASEQLKRTFTLGKDIKGVNPLNQQKLDALMSCDVKQDLTEKIEQIYISNGDDIIIYTDYGNEGYKYSDLTEDDRGKTESALFGKKLVDYEKDGFYDVSVQLDNVVIDSDELFKSTNELIRISDGSKNLMKVFKVKSIKESFRDGKYIIDLSISDNEWREVDNYSKVRGMLGQRPQASGLITGGSSYQPSTLLQKFTGGFSGGITNGAVGAFNGTVRSAPNYMKIDAPLLKDQEPFIMAAEIFQEFYTPDDDYYWLLMGTSDDYPSSHIMQTSDFGHQIIKRLTYIDATAYKILYGQVTEADIVGEWDTAFHIKEIGIVNSPTKPEFTDPCEVRTVIKEPVGNLTGYADDLMSAGTYLYRPYIPFMYNSKLCMNITRKEADEDDPLLYYWDMEAA